MLDPRSEEDIDRLRQMAVLLDDENARLHKALQKQAKELAELKGMTSGQAQTAFAGVLDSVEKSASGGFKPNKSERRARRRRAKKKPKERTEYGPTVQEELEVNEVVVELPDDAQACTDCGQPLQEMAGGFESSEFIDIVTRKFVVHRTKRQKYKKSCSCASPIVVAPHVEPPDTLGGRYSVRFCAAVAVDKFVDHQPMRRQERAMGRVGLKVGANVLFNCLWLLAGRMSTTYEALRDLVCTAPVVHIDETGWKSLEAKKSVRQLWGMSSCKGAYYRILPNRSSDGAATMLRDYNGWVISDGLKVYDKAKREGHFKHAGCWGHARRYLVEVEDNFPETTQVLDWVDECFRLEREADDREDTDAERLAMRQTKSKPIVAKIYDWITQTPVPAGTSLEKAVKYVQGQWAKLKVFLDDPLVPMSNNQAERALRCGVIGRKNYQGTRSKRGEIVVATFYSVLETARLHGIDPNDYIAAIARHDLAEDKRQADAPDDFVRQPLLPEDFARLTSVK